MNRVSLIKQEGALRSYFPESEIKRSGEQRLIWTYVLTPSPLSMSYKVKLVYAWGDGVNFYVVEPKLDLPKGETKLKHAYSTIKQRLCLYFPNGKEWNAGKLYVKTIIPWASEWLYHYEIWVATGTWHGGGIHFSGEEK